MIILLAGAFGFGIAACFYAWWEMHDYSKPVGTTEGILAAANWILCPPKILFALRIDCEYGTEAGIGTHLVFAGLRSVALHATIRGAFYRKVVNIRAEH